MNSKNVQKLKKGSGDEKKGHEMDFLMNFKNSYEFLKITKKKSSMFVNVCEFQKSP